MELGVIKKVDDLRKVWPHEAHDFTTWLSKESNLAMLGDAIDIAMELEETESSVGGFNVDIFAKEIGSGRKIIIENQLEETNHDHLGKIITYASGKNAELIIWVVKKSRDEHKQAIEWLNNHTDENIGFFLLEIQLWQINDSALAPKFSVIESPNNWAKTVKASEGLTEREKLMLNYWQSFADYARTSDDYLKHFTVYKPLAQNWLDIWLRGYNASHIVLDITSQKKKASASIYIRDNKDVFYQYQNNASEIESELGESVVWKEANKDCRIILQRYFDVNDPETWKENFIWQINKAIQLEKIIKKYGESKK